MLAYRPDLVCVNVYSRITYQNVDVLADTAIRMGFDDAPDGGPRVQLLGRHADC